MVAHRASHHHEHVRGPMPSRFVISDHALSRFTERYPESSPPDPLSVSERGNAGPGVVKPAA